MNCAAYQEIKLADLCESVDYGYTASAADAPVGPRFLRITDIVSGPIDWKAVPYCEINDSVVPKYRLHNGDVVIARTGATTGYSAFVADPPDAVFASYLVRLKIGRKADPRYVSYFLKSPPFWDYMRGVLGDKSAQPNASAKTMTQVKLQVPPVDEQKAIAHVLGTLDDKIELNRRTNETLEAMARAVFKSWFIDFLPVRANMAAKKQKSVPVLPDAEPGRYFVYALECDDGSVYIGHAENLQQRWEQHRAGSGAQWTKQHPPVRVAYWEQAESQEAAVTRENWLKTGFGRKWLKRQIAAANARTQTGDPVHYNIRQKEHAKLGRAGRFVSTGDDFSLHDADGKLVRPAGDRVFGPIAHLFPDSFEPSPLGQIPKGWTVSKLGDVVSIFDSIRVPLSRRQRGQKAGTYRYYGAASVMDYVDDFLFDGIYVLMGEDGSVTDDDDHPVLQYVWGQFWVNNHAHVLQGASGISTEHLLLFLRQVNIRPYVTGAVQPKLNQGNMKRIPFLLPDHCVCRAFDEKIEALFERIRSNEDESETLVAIRDTLLPKLLSGEIRVKDAEKMVGGTV